MAIPKVTTSWMWQNSSGGVSGLNLDPHDHTLQWFDDAAGCACAESVGEQTFAAYHERGALLGGIPQDVRDEIDSAIQTLETTSQDEQHPQMA